MENDHIGAWLDILDAVNKLDDPLLVSIYKIAQFNKIIADEDGLRVGILLPQNLSFFESWIENSTQLIITTIENMYGKRYKMTIVPAFCMPPMNIPKTKGITMTIQDKKLYIDFRYKVSKSFVLCDKCSNKVPDGYYWTADGGSNTWIIEDGIDPIWGIIQSLNCRMCDECYVFNENKRETIRNLTMFASLGVKFDIFKKLIRNLDHWHQTEFGKMLT